jgi:hypothetical protein
MKREFADIVRNVCRLTNWKAATLAEKQGAVGVACVLAYLRGAKAGVGDLADAIGVSPLDVEAPFKRLLVNGVFSSKMDVRNDPIFTGQVDDKEVSAQGGGFLYTMSSSERTQNAWAILAGIAGGLTGLRESEAEAA